MQRASRAITSESAEEREKERGTKQTKHEANSESKNMITHLKCLASPSGVVTIEWLTTCTNQSALKTMERRKERHERSVAAKEPLRRSSAASISPCSLRRA